jgi:hypothetical protein
MGADSSKRPALYKLRSNYIVDIFWAQISMTSRRDVAEARNRDAVDPSSARSLLSAWSELGGERRVSRSDNIEHGLGGIARRRGIEHGLR